ncbi:MAG: oligosaccharide flippase family protein [Bacteroidales bacterium]|nr:oligosaccharide flippase family protein [Bacteroidales bacterium]
MKFISLKPLFDLDTLLQKLKDNKVVLKFLSSSFLSLPVSIIVSFLTFRRIEPYYMGVWLAMSIFETYATILRLGVVNGMNRELPYYLGVGKTEEANEFAQNTLAFSLLNIVVLLLIVPFVIFRFELNITYLACISVAVFRSTTAFYTTYLSGTFRTSSHFNKLSNIQFINLTSNLLLSPLIYFYGLYGFLAMQVLLTSINLVLLHRFRPMRIKPALKVKVILTLMKTGIPLFLTSYLVSLIDTIPRLFILSYGNEVMLGLYSPVFILISTLALLPSTLGQYYYPKLTYMFGQNNDAGQVWRKIKRLYLVTIIVTLPAILLGYLILDDVIKYFPKYVGSLPYLKIGLLMGPLVLSKLGNFVNVILKKTDQMGIYVVSYAFFQTTSLFILYRLNHDVLLTVIWSQILTSLCLFIVSYFLNQRTVKLSI